MTTAWPRTRIGSTAPSTKSMRAGGNTGPPPVSPPHAAAAAATSARAALRAGRFTAHEPHGLRQALRHARQLGGTLGEVFNGAQLLTRGRGHGRRLKR